MDTSVKDNYKLKIEISKESDTVSLTSQGWRGSATSCRGFITNYLNVSYLL